MSTALHAALALHQAGALDQAEAAYREILQTSPTHGDALNLLGALLSQRGQHQAAIPLLKAACEQLPHHLDAGLNLAKALRLAGRVDDALVALDTVLAAAPARVDALVLRARCLRQLNRPDEACASLQQALTHAPDAPEVHLGLGDLLQTRAPEAAVHHYGVVLAHLPTHAGALNNLALVHKAAGRLADARGLLERAVTARPGMIEACNNLGNVLLDLGETDAAIQRYEQALAAQPDNPVTQIHLGNALRLAGRHDAARTILQACLARHPGQSGAYNNLGVLLDAENRHGEAIEVFQAALQHAPQDAAIWANLSGALLASGKREDARTACERALALHPESAVARFALANLQLLEGDWQAGWQNYEFRWQGGQQAGRRAPRPALPWPQWLGQAVPPGQSLLVFHEQGFGDTLQFMRYLPALCAHFARIVFLCQPPLLRLARANLPDRIALLPSDAATDIATRDTFDWQLPLLSLPRALQLVPGPAPETPLPLLRPASPAQPLQVGLCFSGNPALTADAERSIPLARFDALLNLPTIRWHALNHGTAVDDPRLIPALDGVQDFADTAARIATLDLVISVDTAVAHLAASLGKPVWLLNRFAPDWRWGHTGERSPWYPSLRQFRQPAPGNWEAVLAEVHSALRATQIQEPHPPT
jgi:tetratricopeptide (TPR) repeat protein